MIKARLRGEINSVRESVQVLSAIVSTFINVMFYVIYEQRERVFHRDIQTRENNV